MSGLQPIITVTMNTAIDRIVEVEDFAIGGHQPGRLLGRVTAGKGVNVSRALDGLGVASVATGFVGQGELEYYEDSFQSTRVQAQFLGVDGATRENITVIDPASRVETHIRGVGVTPTDHDLDRLANKLNLLAKPGALVLFSGSMPPEVELDRIVKLVDLVLSKGASVGVDGPGEVLAALRDRKLWMVKPNRRELAAMHGVEAVEEAELVSMGRALSNTVRNVIVTCGSAGAYLFVDDSAFLGQVDHDPKQVRSTVGCGDCMTAAFVAAQLRGDDIKESFRFGLAVATAAALNDMPGRFEDRALRDLRDQVTIQPAD